MKKYFAIIPLALLISLLYIIPSYASTLNDYINDPAYSSIIVGKFSENSWRVMYFWYSERTFEIQDNMTVNDSVWGPASISYNDCHFDPLSEPDRELLSGFQGSSPMGPFELIVYIRGNLSDPHDKSITYQEYFEENEPNWWDYVKEWWFYDFGISALIDWLFCSDDNNFPDTEIITPSLTPSPTPTPVVRVVTVSTPGPNNTTITNTYYEYIDPSTNQPTTSPDKPSWYHGDGCNCIDCGGGNNGGGGDKEPEDYEPIAINFGVPSATPYVLETENPLLYDYGDNITEYKDGIETVSQLTTVFPEKWYIIIGIIITFPIIAGFITKLLK